MHAIHTLAHRAPPASPPSYTPPTTVISPCEPAPVCDNKSERSAPKCPLVSSPDALRDANTCKNKFALGLVDIATDRAVKTLCEVWRPQDIPPAFSNPRTTKLAASLPNLSSATILDHASLHRHAPKALSTKFFAAPGLRDAYSKPPSTLKLRPKIPELAHLERIGKGTNGEPELGPRFFQATEEEIEQSRREEALELSVSECEPIVRFSEDENEVEVEMMDTVRVEVDEDQSMQPPDAPSMNQQQSASLSSISTGPSSLHIEETESTSTNTSTASSPLIPSPIADLPSPLLCPRRAFLAALIPASKFTQDKCYSNRAWAKLSGLPPRKPAAADVPLDLLHDTRGSMNSAFFDDASQSGVFFNRGCVSTGSSRSPDFRVRLQTLAAGRRHLQKQFRARSRRGFGQNLVRAAIVDTIVAAAAAAAAGDSECRLDRATSASRSTPDDAATEPGAEWDNERDRLTTPDLLQAEPSSSTPSNAISLEDSQVIPRPPAHRTSTMLVAGPNSACEVCLEAFRCDGKAPCSISCGHVFCVDVVTRSDKITSLGTRR
ncbi:hypothetical protein DFP72DRAFT_846791 [Ephemerocybe angulata]|uniref:RING-type domain-containing protein n=1 Tax=Ephemerocybe angulata TaxID=980116 RepID=A0A8H6I337_9AGAR|nr:hypothetical protein DFP72DRAFT_846791 [Tulosesus angulatus]